ncbi:hypothetical protein [Streptomyces sp. KHY 26]|uniref:hypothetical protein n=1 Tax=Streptomyces sp. KHY 26 TaxID=3097359 RepID=UPI00376F32F4
MTAWTRRHCTCVEVRNLTYEQAAAALAITSDRWLRDNISRLPHQKFGQQPAVFCHCDLRLIQAMRTVMPPEALHLLDAPADQPANQHEGELPYGRCEDCRTPLTRPGRSRCAGCKHLDPVPGQRRRGATSRQRTIQPPLLTAVPPAAEPAEPARPPFQWKPEDPLAPTRICGCGRDFKSRTDQTCQDCQFAAHQEAVTA